MIIMDMKKYIILLMNLLVIAGCGDMNELHQIYLDRGETIYTGAVDSLEVRGGLNRVQLKWEMNADPRIKDLVIRWNNRADSVVLPIDRSEPERVGIFKDSLILDKNLSEGSVLFQLYTRDDLGHTSVLREVTGEVYGDNFAASAALKLPRKIEAVQTISTTSVKIVFAEVDQLTMVTTKVFYTCYDENPDGEEKVVEVPNEETELLLEGIRLGDEIQYQGTFLPEINALDAFDGKMYSYSLPDMVLPNTGDSWVTLEGSWYSYWGRTDLVGAGRFLEVATGEWALDDGNCYTTNLAIEPPANWRLGLKINKDYSIIVYLAKPHLGFESSTCKYTPEKCYFDPDTGIIHFDYEVNAPGAWILTGETHMRFIPAE